jgi:signal transduction histidine kinase
MTVHRAALRDETRKRLAGELLDVVAHELGGLSLQIGAARRLVEHDPVRTHALLGEVHRTATRALADVRRLVELDPRSEARRLTPSLASLGELVDEHLAAGHVATLHGPGAEARPPAAIGLVVHSVVRETLAHIRRSPDPGPAAIAVRAVPRALEAGVVWDPGPEPEPLDDLLVVLEVRAAPFGGTVTVDHDASWRAISVRLPLEEAR